MTVSPWLTKVFVAVAAVCLVCFFVIHLLPQAEVIIRQHITPRNKNRNSGNNLLSGLHPHVPQDMITPSPKLRTEFDQFSNENILQDDPRLLNFIRNEILEERRPYVPKLSHNLYKTPQATEIAELFENHKEGEGFFVEAGGLDGERSSNTIWFEKKWKWSGLLVEMDPSYYLQLRGKNRKCVTANACLSTKGYPHRVPFAEDEGGKGHFVKSRSRSTMDCMCFPLFSLMLAMNRTRIDYFSLDVEGQELNVLKTIPFDRLDITTLSVEYAHTDKEGVLKFMKEKGYTLVKTLSYEKPSIIQYSYDYIFKKN